VTQCIRELSDGEWLAPAFGVRQLPVFWRFGFRAAHVTGALVLLALWTCRESGRGLPHSKLLARSACHPA
jgi:hypothetical protein